MFTTIGCADPHCLAIQTGFSGLPTRNEQGLEPGDTATTQHSCTPSSFALVLDLRRCLSAPLACAAFCPVAARKKQLARTQFENAERMREALNGRPPTQRKERDYKRVIDAYRQVYYIAPTSTKADEASLPSLNYSSKRAASFHSSATLTDAIGQYEFLRNEYPGSKHRVEALFTIAQIYKDDLNDQRKRARPLSRSS